MKKQKKKKVLKKKNESIDNDFIKVLTEFTNKFLASQKQLPPEVFEDINERPWDFV